MMRLPDDAPMTLPIPAEARVTSRGERIRTLAQAALRTLRALDEMLEREHPTRLRGVS